MFSIIHSIPLPVKGFLYALVLCLLFMPGIIQLLKKQRWFDKPDNRKIHKAPVPTMGGIVIFISMLIVAIARPSLMTPDVIIVLMAALVLFITGIYDDLRDLRARTKLYIQIVAATAIVFYGIRVEGLQIIGIENFSWPVSAMLSIFCIVFFINAFNLIDGVDGLAGGLSIISLSAFSVLFYFAHAYDFAFLSAALAGSCLGFLFFNFNPARIFMGDTGSLTIGFFLAVFTIHAIQLPENIFYASFKINSFSVAFALIFLPSLDAARVFTTRIIKGISAFKPDRTHIHHLMLDAGMNHKSTSLTFYGMQILILSLAVFPQSLPLLEIIFGILILATITFETIQIVNYKKQFVATLAHIETDTKVPISVQNKIMNKPEIKLNGKSFAYLENRTAIKISSRKTEKIIETEKLLAGTKV